WPRPLLETIMAASIDGVVAYDTRFRCVLWNHAVETLTGVPAGEALERDLFQVLPFWLENGEEELLRQALEGRTSRCTGRRYRVPSSGKSGYYDSQHSPWLGDRGEVMGGIAILRDVTAA